MKKTHLFLLLGFLFTACENTPESYIQKTTIDDICFSYYLTNKEGENIYKFAQGEVLFVHLDIQNNRSDTIMAYAENLGGCYDNNKCLVESMSAYISTDSLPIYKTISQNSTIQFAHAFIVTASAGVYNYRNPQVSIYIKGNESNVKEYTLPLNSSLKIK